MPAHPTACAVATARVRRVRDTVQLGGATVVAQPRELGGRARYGALRHASVRRAGQPASFGLLVSAETEEPARWSAQHPWRTRTLSQIRQCVGGGLKGCGS